MRSAGYFPAALALVLIPLVLTACGSGDDAGAMADREALSALYNSTQGAQWFDNANWLTDAPLGDWYGVTAGDDGRVTGLDLSINNLEGTIPPELGRLERLERLNCSYNRLSGPIPPELGNLSNLVRLLCYQNALSGPIPPELGNLSNLRVLDFYDNKLTGPLSPELGQLSSLIYVDIEINGFTGAPPPELGRLSNLVYMRIGNNRLTGELPRSFAALTKMTDFSFEGNDGLCAAGEAREWLRAVAKTAGPDC